MSDCISRAEAIKALEYDLSIEADGGLDVYRTVIKDLLNAIYNTQKAQIEALPSIQPKPKTGHWITVYDRWGEEITTISHYKCSECGNFDYDIDDYCPNCGARMEVKE